MLNFGEHEEFDDISSVCFYEETEIIDDTKIHKYSLKSNENKENFKFQDDDLKKKEYDNIDNEKTRTNTNFLKNEMEEKDINDNILEKNFDQTYNFVIDDDNNVNKKNEVSNSNIVFKVEKKNLGRKKKKKQSKNIQKKRFIHLIPKII